MLETRKSQETIPKSTYNRKMRPEREHVLTEFGLTLLGLSDHELSIHLLRSQSYFPTMLFPCIPQFVLYVVP